MADRIQIRRDTAADWTSANPVLSAGELGWESDTSKVKIGDGSTNWQSLGYTIFPPSFADLSGKPTTVAGYGITDALTSVAFADITSKPTTVAGYGITDALTQVAFSDLVNKPTTIGGYGITDAFNGAFSSLTGRPTTISGYGITDAFSGAFSALTGKPTTLAGYGITDSFSGAFSSLTGTPTTLAGYGITDAAPKASPALTGVPTAPTATLTTSTTQIATTSFATGKVQEAIATSNRVIFQDSAPSFTAFGEIWLDTNGGGLYKSVASTTIVPLDSGEVSTSSSSITIPAQGASDTRLVLDTSNSGLPNGSVSLTTPLFLEVFSSTGVNQPSIGTLTYHDDTTQVVNSNSYSRSSGNHFDKKVKSFTYYSAGTANTGNSYITLTVSGIPAWEIQSADTQTQINAVIDGAPGALDTLNELAAALNDDANFSTTITNSIGTKAPIISPNLSGTPTAPTASAGTNTSQIATTAFVKSATDGLSVSTGSASGGGSLSFSSGVFTFAPADLSSIAFSAIQSKPTTVSGYGITDALTTGADADIGSNDFITTGKVYFANKFNNVSDLPNATTYHGMFAHVHATGAAYFAHGGNWVELTNKADTNVVSIGDAAPSSPAAGDLWFDSGNLNLYVYYNDGNSNQWVQTNPTGGGSSGGGGSGISSVAADTTPQLGGNLDVNGNSIVSASNGNIPITPNGTGKIILDGLSWPTADGSSNQVLKTDGSGNLSFVDQSGGGGGGGGGSYSNSDVDTHLNRSTAATGEVLAWNGSDYDWVPQEFIKSYRYNGTLSTNTGTKRLYLQKGYVLKSVHAYIDTTSAGAAVSAQIKKNGSNLQAISIAAGSYNASQTSLSHSIAANDYLTIDITQVGSSTAGENLYLVFTFN